MIISAASSPHHPETASNAARRCFRSPGSTTSPGSRQTLTGAVFADLRPLGGFAGKIVGSAARFAALHHLGWYRLDGLVQPITVGSVTRGIMLAQYTIEHYRYVMAATGFITEIAIANRINQWCQRGQRSEFSRRDAQRELSISRVEDLEGPLRLLEDNGYVRSVGLQHAPRPGRKPSTGSS
jgi:hypothetical protein